jgi:hypothetical protein
MCHIPHSLIDNGKIFAVGRAPSAIPMATNPRLSLAHARFGQANQR